MLQGHDRHQGGNRRNEKTADKVPRQDGLAFPACTARNVLRWQMTLESFPDAAQVAAGDGR